MFGIMSLKTGKCWPSQGLWYKDTISQYIYRSVNIDAVAVPKDYINIAIVRLPKDLDFYEAK